MTTVYFLHGKVAKQSDFEMLTYESGDRPIATQTNRGVRSCADRQILSVRLHATVYITFSHSGVSVRESKK